LVDVIRSLDMLDAELGVTATKVATALVSSTDAIDRATIQAEVSSREVTSIAKESARFSGQLNRLTIWVIMASVLSAVAAVIQAVVTLGGSLR